MGDKIISGIISLGEEMTFEIGRTIGRCLSPGAVVALIGELGCGKTVLTRGIARGRGVDSSVEITSPTFTIINEYPGPEAFFHMDAYRLQEGDNLIETGFGAGEDDSGVWVIEWADRIIAHLPPDRLTVYLEYRDEAKRTLTLEGNKNLLEKIVELSIKEGLINGVNCSEVRGNFGGQPGENRKCGEKSGRRQGSG